ncbi:MAG: hypothetical protein WBF08_09440 [Candidatus Bathyarchaeia archaeon]
MKNDMKYIVLNKSNVNNIKKMKNSMQLIKGKKLTISEVVQGLRRFTVSLCSSRFNHKDIPEEENKQEIKHRLWLNREIKYELDELRSDWKRRHHRKRLSLNQVIQNLLMNFNGVGIDSFKLDCEKEKTKIQ